MRTPRTAARGEAGFTLIELLVSTAIMLLVTASVFSLLNPSYGTFQAQPEVADMQQRMRVAADTIQTDLVMAGAGMYSGAMVGTLDSYFSPLLPHRVGTINADPAGTFRANPQCPTTCASAVTIMYVPTTTAQTTISNDMPTPSAELKVDQQPGCPVGDDLCGFKQGMRVLIMNPSGDYDIFTITEVQSTALHLQHRDDKFTTAYPAGSWITQIVSHTYYLEDNGTDTFQLRHYDGFETDLPLVDNVVDFRVEFFGDPSPPQVLRPATDTVGPWTTYRTTPAGTGHRQLQGHLGVRRELRLRGGRCHRPAGAAPGNPDARGRQRAAGEDVGLDADRRAMVPGRREHVRRRDAQQVRRGHAAGAPRADHPPRAGGQ